MVLFPLTAFRVGDEGGRGHARGPARERATSATSLPKMLTRAELYDLLGYTGYEARDRAYFGER